jgi:hypothetical protein
LAAPKQYLDPFYHKIILVLFEVIFPVTQIVPQIVPKPTQKMQFFKEVLVLFEVLLDVLFLSAMIACDLTLPTHFNHPTTAATAVAITTTATTA